MELDGRPYQECLESNRTFSNPSAIEHLSRALGVNSPSSFPSSFLKGLK